MSWWKWHYLGPLCISSNYKDCKSMPHSLIFICVQFNMESSLTKVYCEYRNCVSTVVERAIRFIPIRVELHTHMVNCEIDSGPCWEKSRASKCWGMLNFIKCQVKKMTFDQLGTQSESSYSTYSSTVSQPSSVNVRDFRFVSRHREITKSSKR